MQSRREFQPSPPAQAGVYEYYFSEEIKTFHDTLLRRSRSKDFENNTWKTYRTYLFRFLRWTNKPLNEIGVSDVRSYEAYLKSVKKAALNTLYFNGIVLKKLAKTLRKTHCNFKEIYDFYDEEGLPPKEDLEEIESNKRNDLPTDDEVERLIQNAKCVRDKAIILCLAHVGLRVSEASELNWEDVDFNNRLLWARTKGRNGHKQSVRFDGQTYQALTALYGIKYNNDENYSEEPIFVGQRGRLKIHGIERIVKRASKRAQITKNIYPHILRNYCLTKCALLSSEALARRQARHKARDVTQHYIILDDQTYWKAYEKVWDG